ncbi:hypothetical protein [Novipirellula artificiosorum]|uniref:hypothetical protein n=1 Tax=Novipirellula artificiosorum TaxID=2528016 RepID=UPI0011B58B43|nr:hypothetical protein [Novipirellula artificiosorum]
MTEVDAADRFTADNSEPVGQSVMQGSWLSAIILPGSVPALPTRDNQTLAPNESGHDLRVGLRAHWPIVVLLSTPF